MNNISSKFAVCCVIFVIGCGKPPAVENGSGGRSGEVAPVGDEEKLQGAWDLETAGDDIENQKLKPGSTEESIYGTRFTFAGNRLTLSSPPSSRSGTFALDAARTPKLLTWTRPPDTASGIKILPMIYAFEGDTLVLALNYGGEGDPPTEFKTIARLDGPSVAVFRLTKRRPIAPTAHAPAGTRR